MIENSKVKDFYNLIVDQYTKDCFDELDRKPFDRSILQRFSQLIKTHGKVYDIGCGPGEIARCIKDLGVDVTGIDLSENMVVKAKKLCPDIKFEQGNMLNLNIKDNSIDGITAFYAIVNLNTSEVEIAFSEFSRVLIEDGYILLSFHIGDNQAVLVEKEVEGKKVSIDFIYFNPDEIISMLENAGFAIEEAIIRYPYKGAEYQSKRAYILANKKVEGR